MSKRTPADVTEAHRRMAIDFLIPKHHLDRKSERVDRESFIKDGETRVVGKQCGELAHLLADALASQAESHATELARLKEEHRAELEKAWDDGAHLCYVDGYEDASRRDPVGTTVTPNPHRKQSKEPHE